MADNVFLGLGSNLGDRTGFIKKAVSLINESNFCEMIEQSSIYESTPYGQIKQDNFINAVIKIETNFEPIELLKYLKEVEEIVGRKKLLKRWGPREIDIDILFYNNLIYTNNELIIPHPEIMKRDFVIIPMIEIAPEFVHPLFKKKIKDIIPGGLELHIINKISQ